MSEKAPRNPECVFRVQEVMSRVVSEHDVLNCLDSLQWFIVDSLYSASEPVQLLQFKPLSSRERDEACRSDQETRDVCSKRSHLKCAGFGVFLLGGLDCRELARFHE